MFSFKDNIYKVQERVRRGGGGGKNIRTRRQGEEPENVSISSDIPL